MNEYLANLFRNLGMLRDFFVGAQPPPTPPPVPTQDPMEAFRNAPRLPPVAPRQWQPTPSSFPRTQEQLTPSQAPDQYRQQIPFYSINRPDLVAPGPYKRTDEPVGVFAPARTAQPAAAVATHSADYYYRLAKINEKYHQKLLDYAMSDTPPDPHKLDILERGHQKALENAKEEFEQDQPDTDPYAALLQYNPGMIETPSDDMERGDGGTTTIGVDNNTVIIPMADENGNPLTIQEAIDQYYQTHRHLGIFNNLDDATRFQQLNYPPPQPDVPPFTEPTPIPGVTPDPNKVYQTPQRYQAPTYGPGL